MVEPADGPNLPPLRDVIARYGLSARKGLGQNFLLDPNLAARITRAAKLDPAIPVLEIGPGPGGLTRALLRGDACRVFAVEKDHRCIEPLNELALRYPGRLEIREADALTQDVLALCGGKAQIVANLPYNVATALLLRWLDQLDSIARMTLMFQREVAERLAAEPGSKAYGRLSVAAQWRCTVDLVFDVPPGAFVPAPKVTSTLVRFVPRHEPLAPAQPHALARVTAAAFGRRRKMLRSALRSIDDRPQALLEAAAIDGARRAESLTIEEFCRLAQAFVERAQARDCNPLTNSSRPSRRVRR